MSILKFVASFLLAATLTTLHAEKHCPGNLDSVPLHQIEGALIIAPVSINGSGPFDFLIDTGAQVSTIDSQLAVQLNLQTIGSTGVAGVATQRREAATQLDTMQIGAHRVEEVLAVIDNMGQLYQTDPNLRGIVGENFLAHFDFLIDNQHRTLCLDGTGTMAAAIKGSRLPLMQPYGADHDLPFTRPILIAAQLDGSLKPTLLRLDSGSNVAVLYASGLPTQTVALSNAHILTRVVGGSEQSFAVLPPRQVAAAGHVLGQIAFVQPVNSIGFPAETREDGLLPTAVFQRVFISYRSGFAILDPR